VFTAKLPVHRHSFAGSELARRKLADFTVSQTDYRSNQEILRHRHDLAYISIALRGSYIERHESTSSEVLPGEVILHLPGESHSNRFHESGGEILNLELNPSFLDRMSGICGIQFGQRLALRSPFALQLGAKLHKEFSCSDPASSLALEGLTMELMAEIFRNRHPKLKANSCEWLDTVTEMLNDKYSESITLDEIATCVSVHPVHLARAFRKRHLCSIGEYLRRLRIEAACRDLLESNASISEIALQTGFSDQSHLCRALRQYVGMSPRQFRKSRSKSTASASATFIQARPLCSGFDVMETPPITA
jgi:AraC family transcriptional regulator